MDDDVALWVGYLVAGLGPLAVAALLAPLAEHPAHLGIVVGALVFVIANATVLAGAGAGAVATVAAALTFDFTVVAPSSRLELGAGLMSWPVILLVVAGLSIVAGAHRARRRSSNSAMSPAASPNQSSRIGRIARLVEQGTDPRDLISALQAELTGLLFARHCEFDDAQSSATLPRIDRGGRMIDGSTTLHDPPPTLELPVGPAGRRVGRFVITTTAGMSIPVEHRIVAVILADHLAAALTTRPSQASP